MMYYRKFKKFSAAVTAAAMFGTLGMSVFATEDIDPTEIPEVPVIEAPVTEEDPVVTDTPVETEVPDPDAEAPAETEAPADPDAEAPAETEAPDPDAEVPADTEEPEDKADLELATNTVEPLVWDKKNKATSKIQIKSATATVDKATGIYSVALGYEIKAAEADNGIQVTLLGYVFEGASDPLPTLPEGNAAEGVIRAIEQKENTSAPTDPTAPADPSDPVETEQVIKGTIDFKLALNNGDYSVTNESTLVVKVGSDAASATAAQAIIIDLAGAEEVDPGTDILYGDVDGVPDEDGNYAVSMSDINYLARHISDWSAYKEIPNPIGADVNCDGFYSMDDINIIARHISDWSDYKVLPIPVVTPQPEE